MSTVTVRFNSIMQSADGLTMEVDAILPDGSHFRGAVPAIMNRDELALSLAHRDGARIMPGMTGIVDIDEDRWNAARAAGKQEAEAAATPAEAPASASASAKAEKASK